jgi:beta-mannosidase
LELLRYTADGKVAASKRITLNVAERQQKCWNVEALLGGFFDATYAYRFGPREFTLLHARLWAAPNDSAQIADRNPKQPDLDSQQRGLELQPQALLAEAFYYPIDTGLHISEEPELEVWAEAQKNGDYELVIKTKRFARALAINVYPFLTDDNYFDMAPGTERRVKLAASLTDKPLRGAVAMFNGHKSYPISIREPSA